MNNRLEQYIEEVKADLRHLPEAEQGGEVAEIRAHLEALTAQYEALGLSEETATATALEQFGSAKTLNKGLRRARWRAMGKQIASFWWGRDSIPVATFFSTSIAIIAIILLTGLVKQLEYKLLSVFYPHLITTAHAMPPETPVSLLWFLLVDIGMVWLGLAIAGMVTARIAPRTSLWGMTPLVAVVVFRLVPELSLMLSQKPFPTVPFLFTGGLFVGLMVMVLTASVVRRRRLQRTG
jgi:hypothetical protein